MAHLGQRLGPVLFALGILMLAQPVPSVGAAGEVAVVRSAVGPRSVMALGRPAAPGRVAARQRAMAPGRAAAPGRTPAPVRRTPPPAKLPEPASNRAYGLPVALAIMAVGGVLSLLVRALLAEGSRPQRPQRT